MFKSLKGNLSISRVRGGGMNSIRIEVVDEVSGLEVLRIELDLGPFAEALTGKGDIPCNLNLNTSDNIGKKHEHKQVFVPVTLDGYNRKEYNARILEAAKEFEVDGWVADAHEPYNPHKYLQVEGQEGFELTFRRWVGI